MEKLIRGEASRIVAVLDELAFSLSHLAQLPEREQLDDLAELFRHYRGNAVADSLLHLRHAEKRLHKAARGNSKDQVDQATAALHEAVRGVVRALRKCPTASEVLGAWSHRVAREPAPSSPKGATSPSSFEEKFSGESKHDGEGKQHVDEIPISELLETLQAFRTATFERLTTTVEQADAKTEFFKDIRTRIRQQEQEITEIRAGLEAEAERERELGTKQDTINKLIGAIQDLFANFDKDKSEMATQGHLSQGGLISQFEEQRAKGLKTFDEACSAFVTECEQFRESEEALSKKLNRNLADVNRLIRKFDVDMLQKRKKI
mmetsp:Transcript_4585/g.11758  ORF Transcript_4585/g.11758 Transcript_4585/m.11758 type:complete len:320 (-) Transcript_4585:992-1951(-)